MRVSIHTKPKGKEMLSAIRTAGVMAKNAVTSPVIVKTAKTVYTAAEKIYMIGGGVKFLSWASNEVKDAKDFVSRKAEEAKQEAQDEERAKMAVKAKETTESPTS